MRKTLTVAALALGMLAALPAAADGEIKIRITPPNKAQFLAGQKFDIRVEASGPSGSTVSGVTVQLDGVDITSKGQADSPAGNVRNWIYRSAALGVTGARVFTAAATGTSGSAAITGASAHTIGVRPWDTTQVRTSERPQESFPEADGAARRNGRMGRLDEPSEADAMNESHLGANPSAFFRPAEPNAVPQRKAKNVILLIGDGMGITHRTAGRVLSKGYTQGKANGTQAMDRFPFNGSLMTSSLSSLITDSAPGAHNYSTGNKTNNGMEGVFPDNTSSDADNPQIENLSSLITRWFGKATGIVSDAFITDATPAAFIAHTSDRGDGTLIASQYFDSRNTENLKVLLGGGGYHFIPKSQTGSRRTDERNVINDFKGDGYTYVETASALNAFTPGADAKLLGLFNIDNMDVAFDKLKKGNPANVAAYPDQPMLKDMAKKAIDVLKHYPNGFFLMVEGAHIDKQAHRMDGERSAYEVIQFDQAVQAALDFAIQTNTDSDLDNDTLVIVTADHECAGMTLPAVSRPEKKGTRDFAKTYNYNDGAVKNDSATLNFTDYVDADGDGFPDNPNPDHKLIFNFGANSDRYEDWQPSAKPKDPGVVVNGVAVANEADPAKADGVLITGVIENGANGGEAQTQAVHTMADIQISAYGPGASQFARVQDNTEAFYCIWNSFTGGYPIPAQW